MKILRTGGLGSNFTGSYIIRKCSSLRRLILLANNKPSYSVAIQFDIYHFESDLHLKAVAQRCSLKKVFLEIS